MKLFKKYPIIYLAVSPILFVFATPLTMIPGMILSVIFFSDICANGGELCMLGPSFLLIAILNVLFAYLLSLFIYQRLSKPSLSQLLTTSALLGMYYVLVFGGAYSYDLNTRTARSEERASIHARESAQTVADLSLIERNSILNSALSENYDAKTGIVFAYSSDFELQDHQAPSNYYLRTYNTDYETDDIAAKNNNRFIGFNNITLMTDLSISNDLEAMRYLLDAANRKYTPVEHPKVLKKTIEKVTADDGKTIYYLERGNFNKDSQVYDEMYVLVDVGNGTSYFFETYTTMYDGNEIAKEVVENSAFQ